MLKNQKKFNNLSDIIYLDPILNTYCNIDILFVW